MRDRTSSIRYTHDNEWKIDYHTLVSITHIFYFTQTILLEIDISYIKYKNTLNFSRSKQYAKTNYFVSFTQINIAQSFT